MRNTIENYGWIIVCLLAITILISLATPLVNVYKDNIINNTAEIEDGMIDNLGIKLPYPVTVKINLPDAGKAELVGDHTGSRIYLRGFNTITFKAIAFEGYQFDGWYLGNELISTERKATLNVEKRTEITAVFSKIEN